MKSSLFLTRLFFLLFAVAYGVTYHPLFGLALGGALAAFEFLLRRFNLSSLTGVTLGLLVGCGVGKTLTLLYATVIHLSALEPHSPLVEGVNVFLFLLGTYLGVVMTLRASDELHVSFPFVKFSALTHKKKDLILDSSVLSDARIVDLAASGLVDHHLVLPQFLLKDLYAQAEMGDELFRNKAKRALEVVKKLEQIPSLEMRIHETDFPEIKDPMSKLIHLARSLDGVLLTADISRIQISTIEGVRVINIHALSNALKPLMQAGEKIKIKIQRFGKEARQGVGYLEDGTMVVINGGGDFVGEMIDALVLSVKHTSSGRMIFCNALDGQENFQPTSYEIDGNH